MKPCRWAALCCRVGFRGATLLWLAFLDVIYGLSLVFPAPQVSRSASSRWIAEIAPLPAWGALWLLVAAVLIWCAFRRKDAPAFAAAVSIKVVWASLTTAGWILGEVDRGWVSGVVWAVFAGWAALVSRWPEPPKPLHLNEDMTVRGD
jgi:hypothetical protein